jgi:hypothetical protein
MGWPLEIPRRRWDNVETNLTETGFEDVDWMHLAVNLVLVNTVINRRVQSNKEHSLTSSQPRTFSRRSSRHAGS